MSAAPAVVWFRRDLRLRDHPALAAALAAGRAVVPVFIWSPEEEGEWPPGPAARWWLQHALAALDAALRRHGSRLVVRRGPALPALRAVVRATRAGAVYWNRRYEPAALAHDIATKQALLDDGLEVKSFSASLLHEPTRIATRAGEPFQVFTPFWKHCRSRPVRAEVAFTWATLPVPPAWPDSLALEALELATAVSPDRGWSEHWQPGEAAAHHALAAFIADELHGYATGRDQLDRVGTSRLSPHLRWGEIGPVQIWHALQADGVSSLPGTPAFLRELGWREFAYHLLFHFPHTATEPMRPEFGRFPWRVDAELMRAWQQGRTGYPLVDAAMRQLQREGWIPNRVRMIAASFLVKHLLQPWTEGARWFWATLVDADLANNTLGWQWTAGCGADAAPFFRIFNPTLQADTFDAAGTYERRLLPELAQLPDEYIHAPWTAPADVLAAAGVRLGENYPHPIVAHPAARARALAAFAAMRAET